MSRAFTYYLSILLVLLFTTILTAQSDKEGITKSVTATGNTYGVIAYASLTNLSSSPANEVLPSGIIPSPNGYQSFILPFPQSVTVPGGGKKTVAITGYCLDPNLDAPPPGTLLPDPSLWDPATDVVTTTRNIITSTTRIIAQGVTTPFHDDQKDRLVLYTVWTSLPDPPLTLDDICERLTSHVASSLNTPLKSLTTSEKETLNTGILTVKDVVSKIRRDAAIPAYKLPPISPLASIVRSADAPSHPIISNTIRIKGTGQTTGHIADLNINNPTKEPVQVKIGHGSMYIPSNGPYQSYVVPRILPIDLAPGEKKSIPVTGYCADITKPPVPDGNSFPPLTEWISIPPSVAGDGLPQGSVTQVLIPTSTSLSLHDATALLTDVSELFIAVDDGSAITTMPCPPGTISTLPVLPGSTRQLVRAVSPEEYPGVAAPLVIHALDQITSTYTTLKETGNIHTPFISNPPKEREAVIQQTLWIYTSELRDEEYDKDLFRAMTYRQFDEATGRKAEQLPEPEKEKLDAGVDDFWNTFKLVGAEAKILPVIPPKVKPEPGDLWDKAGREKWNTQKEFQGNNDMSGATTSSSPADTPSIPDLLTKNEKPKKDEREKKEKEKKENDCTCGDITLKADVTVGKGKAEKIDFHTKEINGSVKESVTVDAKVASNDEIIIKLHDVNLKNACDGKCGRIACTAELVKVSAVYGETTMFVLDEKDETVPKIDTVTEKRNKKITGYNVSGKIPEGKKPGIAFKITIAWNCTAKGCEDKLCPEKTFWVRFVRK